MMSMSMSMSMTSREGHTQLVGGPRADFPGLHKRTSTLIIIIIMQLH